MANKNHIKIGDTVIVSYITLFNTIDTRETVIIGKLRNVFLLENSLTITSELLPFNFQGSVKLKDQK